MPQSPLGTKSTLIVLAALFTLYALIGNPTPKVTYFSTPPPAGKLQDHHPHTTANTPTSTMATPSMMRAAVMHTPGPPSVLKLTSVPIPSPKSGQVLIRVKAFGLNRSEMFTRQGHSPGLSFPRILGIEATGTVESAPGAENRFKQGDIVATAMGGMGRNYDGGYAEYVVVPAAQVQAVNVPDLSWEQLGSLPELMQTTWGSLYTSLRLQKSDHLLIRGGTSGIGLAAAALAKGQCEFIGATTRNESRTQSLLDNGADEVYIDDGNVAAQVSRRHPKGYTKVLELVGVTTMKDSMQALNVGGLCCITGIVGDKWEVEKFNPSVWIPSGVGLTVYGGNEVAFMQTPITDLARRMVQGTLKVPTKVFKLDDIVQAHELMEGSGANAKIVVLT